MRKMNLMKKGLILIMAGVLLLSGCGSLTDAVKKPDAEKNEENKPEKEEYINPGEDITDVSDDESHKMILTLSKYADTIIIYDPDTEDITTFDREIVFNDLSSADQAKYRIYDKDSNSRARYQSGNNEFLFFSDYQPIEGEEYIYYVFALKLSDNSIYPVWEGNNDSYIEACEYFGGSLYIDYDLGYDDDHYLGRSEKAFVYDSTSDSFKEDESAVNSVVMEAAGKDIRLEGSVSDSDYNKNCYAHDLEEYGFILGYRDGKYVLINGKGKVADLRTPENASIYGYNKNSVMYTDYGDNYSDSRKCIFDIKTGKETLIAEKGADVSMLGQKGNCFYYAVNDEGDNYGLTHNYIYRYDSDTDETTLLYDEVKTPGSGITPGTQGFTISDSGIYYVTCDKDTLKWKRVDDESLDENIVCELSKIGLFAYGEVKCLSNKSVCPVCGTPLLGNYYEYFVLDDSFSDNADLINESLESIALIGTSVTDFNPDYDGSECEQHLEYPEHYFETNDFYISDVKMIRDDYLIVNMSGYWYGGGVHGYPLREQSLFDLGTGEIRCITDFYSGTEEDFKELIAEKTKEDYLSYDYESNPYFASDADAAYNQAYDYVSFDSGCIEFDEDGITYYYPPYDMGPYAAGYIEVFVSYEELLGRSSL